MVLLLSVVAAADYFEGEFAVGISADRHVILYRAERRFDLADHAVLPSRLPIEDRNPYRPLEPEHEMGRKGRRSEVRVPSS